MNEYVRTHPEFSLCGLNCSLCPRHATEGSSRCQGCGATDFADTHPTCAVITCAKKHGSPEFCFACAEYPCERYRTIGGIDSFISYRRVRENLEKARGDIHAYLAELAEREAFLGRLLDRWNDGRRKGFYCLAANDLPIASVREVRASLEKIEAQGEAAGTGALPPGSKERALAAVRLIAEEAEKAGFELALRK